jgi:hypothetical protein
VKRPFNRPLSFAHAGALSLGVLWLAHGTAHAVPSFSVQTDQPCSACHIGAFGPRLKQQGRDFKLYGYVANDTKEHGLPFSFLAEGSFSHTAKDQAASVAAGYNANDNFTFDELAGFYAGKLFGPVGAFMEVAYDAIEDSLHWEDLDIRYAHEFTLGGEDSLIGLTVNNAPSVSDLWGIGPAWSYPFVGSPLAQTPAAAPMSESLPQHVIGAGAYGMWRDLLFVEGDVYHGLDPASLRFLGMDRINSADRLSGPAWYWRVALQHDFDEGNNYGEIGLYGIESHLYPATITAFGSDRYSDIGVDATWQWTAHPEQSVSDMLEAHVLYLTETARLNASSVLSGTNLSDHLTNFRAELTYSFGSTFTPTLQYFRTGGTADAARWPTFAGSPDSAGWIAEFDYTPWGKPDSPWGWFAARIALQYIAYTTFDGTSAGASDFNTLLLNVTLGAAAN